MKNTKFQLLAPPVFAIIVLVFAFNTAKAQNFMQNGRVGFDSTLYHPSNFGIGFDNPTRNIIEPSALIEMQADDKGLLIPRMTADQMTAIAQPANSLLVYNTTDSVFNFYDEKTDEWKDLSKGEIWFVKENNNVILSPKLNFVGIGTENPQTKLHIFTKTDDFNLEMPPPTIRIENNYKNKYYAWDIQNDKKNLKINFGENKESVIETETKFVFTDETYFGIGTETPMANLHINNQNQSSNSSNIILEAVTNNLPTDGPPTPTKTFFEIENKKGKFSINYFTNHEYPLSLINFNPKSYNLTLFDKCTVSSNGTVTATKFIANGVDISKGAWTPNGDDIYYPAGNVGIGDISTPNTNLHIYAKGNTSNDFSNFPTISLDYENNPTGEHSNWKIYSYYDGGFRLGFTNTDTPHDYGICFMQDGSIVFNGSISNGKFSASDDGHVNAKYVKIEQTSSKDYVFYPDYDLRPIDSLAKFVQTNHHLPEITSEQEIIDNNGIEIGKFSIDLLGKIEELTLYIIELNERIDKLENENKALKNE